MTNSTFWQQRIGFQRDWVWRGWQTRFTFRRTEHHDESTLPLPPLILVHGFGASIEHWRKNIPVLSQQHTVYALDLVGFGASRKPRADYKIDLWVEQVYDFWQTFIGTGHRAILVGNSIGSLVCVCAAAKHPEMVKAIALLNLPDVSLRAEAIPRRLQPIVNGLEGAIASPLLLNLLFKVLRRPAVIRRWAALAYADPAAVNEELVEIFAAPAYDEGAARTFCALFSAIRQPQFSPPVKTLLPQLDLPILLIWGRQDRMVPPRLAQTLLKLNPRLELVELERVGHCPHDESPEPFHQVLLGWLQKQCQRDLSLL